MTNSLEIVPTQSPAAAAGERLARAIARAGARGGACRLAVPGGSALAALPHALRAMSQDTWPGVLLTWVDERCVPAGDRESNRGALLRLGLPPPGAELPLWTDEDADPEAALARVSRGFRGEFAGGLDVVLLGLGEDGHVASLFPGHPALGAGGVAVFVADSPKPPPRRISLTLPVLRAAPLAIMVVTGESKRVALERVVQRDPALPTSSLSHLVICTDIEPGSQCDE